MKKMLLVLSFGISVHAVSQTETDIRNHYQDVNQRIKESMDHGVEGPLYCNEWVTNKNGRSWPAVGVYQETTDFWYDDSPDHISTEERNPKTVLLKVTIYRKSAELTTQEEYLYKNAKLVFYHLEEGENDQQWETRIWFNSKGMFKSNVKKDGKDLTTAQLATDEFRDSKPNPVAVQQSGKKYQDLFVKTML
jgi:hypothetical protein